MIETVLLAWCRLIRFGSCTVLGPLEACVLTVSAIMTVAVSLHLATVLVRLAAREGGGPSSRRRKAGPEDGLPPEVARRPPIRLH